MRRARLSVLAGWIVVASSCGRINYDPYFRSPLSSIDGAVDTDGALVGHNEDSGSDAATGDDGSAGSGPLFLGFGGAGQETIGGVVADSQGNIYVTGSFVGPAVFADNVLASNSIDVFVASFTPSGTYRWAKAFGEALTDTGTGIAIDANDNLYISGNYARTIDFGGGPLASAGLTDFYLASLDKDGNYRWQKRFGNGNAQQNLFVASDASGRCYITGPFSGATDFGGGPIGITGSNFVVAAYSNAGDFIFQKRFVGTSRAITTDASGNVYITGDTSGTDLGDGLTATGIFVFSETAAGGFRWQHSAPGSGAGMGVAVDTNGVTYVAGQFSNTINFGGSNLTSAGSQDIFIASFDVAGVHRFSNAYGGTAPETVLGIATSSGKAYFAGWFQSTLDLGGRILTGGGGADAFVGAVSESGTVTGAEVLADTSSDTGAVLAVERGGSLLFGGTFQGVASFGGASLTSMGGTDLFLARVSL